MGRNKVRLAVVCLIMALSLAPLVASALGSIIVAQNSTASVYSNTLSEDFLYSQSFVASETCDVTVLSIWGFKGLTDTLTGNSFVALSNTNANHLPTGLYLAYGAGVHNDVTTDTGGERIDFPVSPHQVLAGHEYALVVGREDGATGTIYYLASAPIVGVTGESDYGGDWQNIADFTPPEDQYSIIFEVTGEPSSPTLTPSPTLSYPTGVSGIVGVALVAFVALGLLLVVSQTFESDENTLMKVVIVGIIIYLLISFLPGLQDIINQII